MGQAARPHQRSARRKSGQEGKVGQGKVGQNYFSGRSFAVLHEVA
jgi:hypothetical protein